MRDHQPYAAALLFDDYFDDYDHDDSDHRAMLIIYAAMLPDYPDQTMLTDMLFTLL